MRPCDGGVLFEPTRLVNGTGWRRNDAEPWWAEVRSERLLVRLTQVWRPPGTRALLRARSDVTACGRLSTMLVQCSIVHQTLVLLRQTMFMIGGMHSSFCSS